MKTFACISQGASPQEAFLNAKAEANKTINLSSILFKENYEMVTYECLKGDNLKNVIALSLYTTYKSLQAPAACIRINNNPKTYLFYGWTP